MSNHTVLSDNYCADCGHPVEMAEMVHSDEPLADDGVYEKQNGHVIIEGTEIRIYTHAQGDDDD